VIAHRSRPLTDRVARLCASGRIDVVHLDTIALAPLKAACGTVPVVLAHHNIESQLMQRRASHESSWAARAYTTLQARRLRRFEREHCGGFRANITVSEADARLLREICPAARTAVVPNGVDTEYFAPRAGPQEPALIYTGGMNMFANRDAVDWFLEEIWPRILAAEPDTRFHAIGQNPSARLLAAARASDSVTAPGFVPDIRPWVAKSAVYVVPLRVGGGTRLKMVDAMAQGKAIVATSLGAEGIDGTPGVHFLVADTPEDFAAAVIGLLRDAPRRQALGGAARERASTHYAWPRLGEAQLEVYRHALAGAH
jgi:glycosyltransferase involved in cell wall biosynthesis